MATDNPKWVVFSFPVSQRCPRAQMLVQETFFCCPEAVIKKTSEKKP